MMMMMMMLTLNMRLKAKGKVRLLPVVGDLMPYFLWSCETGRACRGREKERRGMEG